MNGHVQPVYTFSTASSAASAALQTDLVTGNYAAACLAWQSSIEAPHDHDLCSGFPSAAALSKAFGSLAHTGPDSWKQSELESLVTYPAELLGTPSDTAGTPTATQAVDGEGIPVLPVLNPAARTATMSSQLMISEGFRTALRAPHVSYKASTEHLLRADAPTGVSQARAPSQLTAFSTAHFVPDTVHVHDQLAATLSAAARLGLVKAARRPIDALVDVMDARPLLPAAPSTDGTSARDLGRLLGPGAFAGRGLVSHVLGSAIRGLFSKQLGRRRDRNRDRVLAGFGLGNNSAEVPRAVHADPSGSFSAREGEAMHRSTMTLQAYAGNGVDGNGIDFRGPVDPAARFLSRVTAVP